MEGSASLDNSSAVVITQTRSPSLATDLDALVARLSPSSGDGSLFCAVTLVALVASNEALCWRLGLQCHVLTLYGSAPTPVQRTPMQLLTDSCCLHQRVCMCVCVCVLRQRSRLTSIGLPLLRGRDVKDHFLIRHDARRQGEREERE